MSLDRRGAPAVARWSASRLVGWLVGWLAGPHRPGNLGAAQVALPHICSRPLNIHIISRDDGPGLCLRHPKQGGDAPFPLDRHV